MQDPDKDASETVIEGEAIPRSGRKKASGNKSNHTHQSGSSSARTLFSLRNLIGFFMFALAAIAGGYWVLNNVMPPSQDSLKLSTTLNEVTERTLQTQQQLAELQDQVENLKTNIGSLEEYVEAEAQDVSPDTLLAQLNDLEARLEGLGNEISRTQIEGSKPLENINFGSHQITQFLDSLWLDSQTGKSLAIYRPLIETLKSNLVEDKSDEVVRSIEQALSGNLSSHARLLTELNRQISEVTWGSATYDKILKPTDKPKIKTDKIEDTSELSELSWADYLAGLFNLRKLSNDNAVQSDSEDRRGIRDEASQKLLLSDANQLLLRANKIPETLSEAIMYLKDFLDNDTSNISSQQLSKLNRHLSQIKSRQQVDKIITEIYQNHSSLPKREKP
ncbi:MAG: Uncharacterised protein [SAR116 cluster bacterium]|jgi:hypothetical protein|nr:MAG: Uncharacterised protein [SAR116 cluster bacterium]